MKTKFTIPILQGALQLKKTRVFSRPALKPGKWPWERGWLCTTKSAKKKCVSSLWIRWKNTEKKEINFLSSGCLFPNVLWLASQLLLRNATSLDSSLSPESIQSFSFSSSLLLSLPPLSSSSLSLLSLSDKGSFSASSQFLSTLFVADQFLQDSFGEVSVWLDASIV